MADLNNDGLNDLVIFERAANLVKTFINYGAPGNPAYRYKPEYALNFPQINHFLKLEDYNCDNIPDLIHRGYAGFAIWKGFYNSQNELSFTFYRDLFYQQGNGWINAYSEPSDIPAVVDVDRDGDLDFLAYFIGGGQITWYRNMRVEDGLPCDSIRVKIGDACWGKVLQGFQRSQSLGYSCITTNILPDLPPDSTQKTTLHTGNTLCMIDMDGDSDYDYLNGNVSFPDVQYFKNGKTELNYVRDSIVMEDTLWGSNGQLMHLVQWPASFWLDIDDDGDRDLLFSPNAENASENYKTIVWYKNIGSDASPNFQYVSDTMLVNDVVDMGAAAYPAVYDYNKDGKPDLFIGAEGFYQANGSLKARIAYYQNTSTPGSPSFTLQTGNFANIDSLNIRGAAPAFGDLDNDGLDDMVVGHSDGSVSFYKNMVASAAQQPQWVLTKLVLADAAGIAIDSGNAAAPFIYDLNNDGRKDLIIGVQTGWMYYYRNAGGTPGVVNLHYETGKLGFVKVDPYNVVSAFNTPFFGKVVNSNTDYLLCGSNSGILYRYTGFQNGALNTPFQRIDSGFSQINTNMSQFSGLRSAPAVGDFDGDGKPELVVGTIHGGVNIYKGDGALYAEAVSPRSAAEARIFPNPSTGLITISWESSFDSDRDLVQILLTDIQGRIVQKVNVDGNQRAYTLMLPDQTGVYVLSLQSSGGKANYKVVRN